MGRLINEEKLLELEKDYWKSAAKHADNPLSSMCFSYIATVIKDIRTRCLENDNN